MEAVLAAPALEAGPVYFFDQVFSFISRTFFYLPLPLHSSSHLKLETFILLQMKTRKKERGKKIPEELSSYVTIDLPGFAPR